MRTILILTLLASASSTNDWLRFRGPNGSGVSETAGIPAVFGAGRNLSWKTSVPFGRSSPVVAGNRIFLTASEGEKLITLCLDRISGKIIWRAEAARARHMPIFKGNDAASPTPVSDGTKSMCSLLNWVSFRTDLTGGSAGVLRSARSTTSMGSVPRPCSPAIPW